MENEIITDWLDKYGNPEIYKKVEDYIEKTNMEDEYIIISKTAIQKRIEELEEIDGVICSHLIRELKQILSQSTPLVPEIEKAIEYGMLEGSGAELFEITDEVIEHQQDYISDLKLNI